MLTIFNFPFLDALAKLRKAIISFVISVRPSVRSYGITGLPLDGFWRNFIFELSFFESVEKIQVSLKSDNNKSTLHEDVLRLMSVSP